MSNKDKFEEISKRIEKYLEVLPYIQGDDRMPELVRIGMIFRTKFNLIGDALFVALLIVNEERCKPMVRTEWISVILSLVQADIEDFMDSASG